MTRVSLIAARARNGVIGSRGALPWRLPEDLAHFKRTTLGHCVIMGRKTWDSLGRPLPGRRNIVITRDEQWHAPGAERAANLEAALTCCPPDQDAFVIGGAQIYAEALERGCADTVLLTEIDADFEGDARFPELDPARWHETAREHVGPQGERPFGFDFVTYEAISPASAAGDRHHPPASGSTGKALHQIGNLEELIMSEDHFHVHGAHDHAVEHAAEHGGGGDPLANRVAVASAVLATLGALMTLSSGDTQADAQLFKNTASIMKTRANDQWNYYQAKGVKANLAEVAASFVTRPDQIDHFRGEAARYKKQQVAIKEKADRLEKEVEVWDARSEAQIHLHHRWAAGATAMQIAIALSAIALLARATWLLWGVGLVAATGLGFAAMALAGV